MVGLLAERPQRGKSGLTDLQNVRTEFENLFASHCRLVEQGRLTGEKALQSFLIREAYQHHRLLVSISEASKQSDGAELLFVTDELALPTLGGGKTVCDVLALRRDGSRSTPVLLELKDARQLTRLVEQVEGYAKLIDEHADLFAELFGVLLGERVAFDAPAEKWIVWPIAGETKDPREAELAVRRIRVVGYSTNSGGGYSFRVGAAV
jgi:hypothetical protein